MAIAELDPRVGSGSDAAALGVDMLLSAGYGIQKSVMGVMWLLILGEGFGSCPDAAFRCPQARPSRT